MNNSGIFTDLATYNDNLPWGNDLDFASRIDLEYFGNVSGNKALSPLVDGLSNNQPLSTERREKIAKMIYSLFNKEWTRLYNVYSVEYNPISNYDMTETEIINNDVDESTSTETESTLSTTSTTDDDVYGFNSSNASHSDKQVNSVATQSNNDSSGSRKVDNETSRELKRSGNIGVTTSQQMIQSEIELWQWNFFKSVFVNLDDILVCNYWEV